MEIVERSIADKARRGCMPVNTGLEVAPHDPEFRKMVAREFSFIEEAWCWGYAFSRGSGHSALCSKAPPGPHLLS